MEDEEEGMQPVLHGPALVRMHPLILGDEERGEDGCADEKIESDRSERPWDQQGAAKKESQSVERMTHSFPRSQTSFPMMMLIQNHEDPLQECGTEKEGSHFRPSVFRKRVPQIVRPGPKARLTIRECAGIDSSRLIRSQMWWSVAEDIFP